MQGMQGMACTAQHILKHLQHLQSQDFVVAAGSSFSSMNATSIVFMLWKLSAVEAFVSSTRNQSSD